MQMKQIVWAAAVAAGMMGVSAPVAAQEGPFMVRVRAVHLDSANKDSTGLGLTINNKWIPEVDISYFFSPNLAAELILTYPQKQTVTSTVVGGDIGTFKHLPPTLTGQYHFTNLGAFKPYVGAGLNFTNISDVHILDGAVNLKRTSTGLALQLGADYEISKGMYLNVDIKKVQIATNVYLSGADQGKFKVDPTLVGVGMGWRF